MPSLGREVDIDIENMDLARAYFISRLLKYSITTLKKVVLAKTTQAAYIDE